MRHFGKKELYFCLSACGVTLKKLLPPEYCWYLCNWNRKTILWTILLFIIHYVGIAWLCIWLQKLATKCILHINEKSIQIKRRYRVKMHAAVSVLLILFSSYICSYVLFLSLFSKIRQLIFNTLWGTRFWSTIDYWSNRLCGTRCQGSSWGSWFLVLNF